MSTIRSVRGYRPGKLGWDEATGEDLARKARERNISVYSRLCELNKPLFDLDSQEHALQDLDDTVAVEMSA